MKCTSLPLRAARVHHAARRRGGGVAARGARAAAGQAADHRVPGRSYGFGLRANGLPLLCSGCANSAGSRAAPSRSSIAGQRDAPSASPRSRPSSSGSRSMSLSRAATAPALAAKQATSVIPIVFAAAADPVGSRPGRESGATGRQRHRPVDPDDRYLLASDSNSCARSSPVFAGWRSWPMSGNPAAVLEMGEVQATARTLGLEVTTFEIRRAEDIAPAFEALKGRAEALYVCADPLVNTNRIRINTWRWARDCRRCTAFGSTSKRAV